MSDASQIVIPPSFVALFLTPGRTRPQAGREHIAQRYELCEDLASALTEPAKTEQWSSGATEADVLQRMHRGLSADAAGLSSAEAVWVVRRLAELLEWPDPGPASMQL
jgi:hypothetical protein